MTDKHWITDRLPTKADADRDGDVIACATPTLDPNSYLYEKWHLVIPGWPWRRSAYWTPPTPEPAPAAPDPEPEPEEDAPPEPVYIYSESSGGYLSTQAVVTDASLYEEAYRKALGRIGEAEHSLRQLEELAQRYRPEARTKINRAANAMLQVQRALHEVA